MNYFAVDDSLIRLNLQTVSQVKVSFLIFIFHCIFSAYWNTLKVDIYACNDVMIWVTNLYYISKS